MASSGKVIRVTATVVMALVLPLTLTTSAMGKLAFDQITVSGPGLEGPVKLRPQPDDFLDMSVVADHSGFFKQLACRSCRTKLNVAPQGALGPRYVLTYSMPSSFNAQGEVRGSDEIVQYVYPYAEPLPVTYMPPHQRYPGGSSSVGGWYVSDDVLTRELEIFGVPSPSSDAASFHGQDATFTSELAPFTTVIAVTGLFAIVMFIGIWQRRRAVRGLM